MHRCSGILLHPTSLPGPYGIGDLGPEAYQFIDFLHAAGQGVWQMLPLGPTGYRDSPYQCTSAFAGNPLLISPYWLLRAGWLDADALQVPEFPTDQVDFGLVGPWKMALLREAKAGFEARASKTTHEEFARFCAAQSSWLEDYALFHALKEAHQQRAWTAWAPEFALRNDQALAEWSAAHADDLVFYRFVQYLFFSQWRDLRRYARERGVRLVGDMPIFVAHDSCDVWTNPHWFELDAEGQPTRVAGVPPDYFSATGQRWGNPLYRWSALAADGYGFWIERLRRVLELVDLVRIDHFRGFANYWEIAASEPTAINGSWQPGPGLDLFRVLRRALGDDLPLIAEDLGIITEDVIELRDKLDLPGMAVLQFGLEDLADSFGTSTFLPHNHVRQQVVYTGTHDNNTVRGWWGERDEDTQRHALAYLHGTGEEINWDLIQAALRSVAGMAVFPLQDVIGLGAEACFNRPGTAEGNWVWRYRAEMLEGSAADRLLYLSRLYGRQPFSVH